jgi:hypothetical protein
LPDFLSGLGEELHKFVGRISQIADTVATGQRCYVEKDSTAARKDHPINVILLTGSQARGRASQEYIPGKRPLSAHSGAIRSLGAAATMKIIFGSVKKKGSE